MSVVAYQKYPDTITPYELSLALQCAHLTPPKIQALRHLTSDELYTLVHESLDEYSDPQNNQDEEDFSAVPLALRPNASQEEITAAIQRGIDDMKAGRVIAWDDVREDFLNRYAL